MKSIFLIFKRCGRPLVFILILISLGSLAWMSGLDERLADVETLEKLKEAAQSNLPLSVALYCAGTIVGSVALALPGIVFALIAGIVFGPYIGTLLCVLAATAGAMLSFLAAKHLLSESVKAAVENHPRLKKWLIEAPQSNAVTLLLITRMIPLFPYNLQNFAYGVTGIPFSTYSLCTLVFMVPGTALYTFAAAGIVDEGSRALYLAIAFVVALAVAILGRFLKKRFDVK